MAAEQVHVDPETLREFAASLAAFSEHVNGSFADLGARIGHLHESWRDQEFEAFIRQFTPVRMALQKFHAEIERVVPILKEDAEQMRRYFQESGPGSL